MPGLRSQERARGRLRGDGGVESGCRERAPGSLADTLFSTHLHTPGLRSTVLVVTDRQLLVAVGPEHELLLVRGAPGPAGADLDGAAGRGRRSSGAAVPTGAAAADHRRGRFVGRVHHRPGEPSAAAHRLAAVLR